MQSSPHGVKRGGIVPFTGKGGRVLSVEARYLEPELPDELGPEYRRTFDRLRGHFRLRGICAEEAADMAQEAAIRAFVHVRRRGVTGENLVPLMNQIARNMLIDRHRRGGPQLVTLDDAADSAVDPALDPTEVVVSLEARRAVRDAVDSLPERHREAILYALAGMNPAEVAERMGIGRNAADALLHRARRSLKERLAAVGESALGVVSLTGLRIRHAFRRAGIRAGIVDPSALGVLQGGFGAAAAALVVALNFGAAPAASALGTGAFAAGGARSSVVHSAAPGIAGAAPARSTTGSDMQTFNAGLIAAGSNGELLKPGGNNSTHLRDPHDSHKDIFGIDYEIYDDGQHSGPFGGQEDVVSGSACGSSPSACNAVRKGLGG